MANILDVNRTNHELVIALAHWLHQPIDDDFSIASTSQEQMISANSAQFPVPMVYSHDFWFDRCLSPLCEEIGAELDAEECNQMRLCKLLLMASKLVQRTPKHNCNRQRMAEFLEAFKQLLRCAEKPSLEQARRLAQNVFMALLDRFEPVAQFLLISHLFQLVFNREVALSEEVYEPHVLAFLVDNYRWRCFPNDNTQCMATFQSQLGHFYNQLVEVVYEDPLLALNFYASVLLLVNAHALARTDLELLRTVGRPLIAKFRVQLREWMDLRQQRAEKGKSIAKQEFAPAFSKPTELMEAAESYGQEEAEQQHQMRLSIFAFQLEEAERNVANAFKLNGVK